MGRETIRIAYPLLYAYGDEHAFLDTEAATQATTEERIRAIWPFLTRRVLAFQQTLKGRERVNFDHEDVLAELWAALAEKDAKWSPERGKFITFAGSVIDSELCSIRDRARTVQSPRNSSGRLKEYKAEAESGTLTARRLKTANDIRRAIEGIQTIPADRSNFGPAVLSDPAASIISRETTDETFDGLKVAIEQLAPIEADVLVRFSGVFGRARESVRQIATAIGRDEPEVRRIKDRAIANVRRYLTSVGHPAALHERN